MDNSPGNKMKKYTDREIDQFDSWVLLEISN